MALKIREVYKIVKYKDCKDLLNFFYKFKELIQYFDHGKNEVASFVVFSQ